MLRLELAPVDATLQLLRPALPEEGGPVPGAELPVEEDRQPELVPHPNCEPLGRVSRPSFVLGRERHERDDVGGAGPRMRPLVLAQVDQLSRAGDAGQQRLDKLLTGADQREDRPVVVLVGVDIEQPRAARAKGCTKRVDRRPIAPLGEVRDGLEGPRHARSLGSVKAYYDRRAPEYDEWYRGAGRFAERERAGWEQEVDALGLALAALRPARTLDVACGTGFLTRHLPGEIVGLDQSEAMLAEARRQAPNARYVQGDALSLPFEDGAFERVFTSHFYGHLEEGDRGRFIAEARRVAPELVVFDAALHDGEPRFEWQERVLEDGSRWEIYKRFFTGAGLLEELGGGDVLFEGPWFVLVRA